MEDEVVKIKGIYEFEIILPEEDISIPYSVNEQFGFYIVDANEQK